MRFLCFVAFDMMHQINLSIHMWNFVETFCPICDVCSYTRTFEYQILAMIPIWHDIGFIFIFGKLLADMVYWSNSSAYIHHIRVHIQYIYAICTKLTAYSYSTNMHNWYLMTYAELQSSTSMLEALHGAINCWQTIHITYIHKVDVYEHGPGMRNAFQYIYICIQWLLRPRSVCLIYPMIIDVFWQLDCRNWEKERYMCVELNLYEMFGYTDSHFDMRDLITSRASHM